MKYGGKKNENQLWLWVFTLYLCLWFKISYFLAPLVSGEETLVLVLFLQVRASEQIVFDDFGFIWVTILCDRVHWILIEYMMWQLLIDGVNNPFSASSGQNVFSIYIRFLNNYSINKIQTVVFLFSSRFQTYSWIQGILVDSRLFSEVNVFCFLFSRSRHVLLLDASASQINFPFTIAIIKVITITQFYFFVLWRTICFWWIFTVVYLIDIIICLFLFTVRWV